MNIFESLENLNVSEECFNDIVSIVEEIINESPTVSDLTSATIKSIPLRMSKYKEVKANPESTQHQVQTASDRLERAVKIKRMLTSKKYREGRKVDDTIKGAIKQATMSPEEKSNEQVKKRQEELHNVWYTQPNHPGNPEGFKYGAKPRAK